MNETNVSKKSEFPESGNIAETAIPTHKTVYKRSVEEIEEGLSSAREALAGGDESVAEYLCEEDRMRIEHTPYPEHGDDYWQTPRGRLVSICSFGNIKANAEDIVDDLIANAHLLDEEVRNPTETPWN